MNDPKYVYIPSHGLWEIWGVVSNEGETIISASENGFIFFYMRYCTNTHEGSAKRG